MNGIKLLLKLRRLKVQKFCLTFPIVFTLIVFVSGMTQLQARVAEGMGIQIKNNNSEPEEFGAPDDRDAADSSDTPNTPRTR